MRTRPALTASDVQQMAAACRTEAEKNKWNVTFAIVYDAGFLLYLERLDGAGPMTAEVAEMKARTAAITRRPTKVWEDLIKDRPTMMKFPNNLPIRVACRSWPRASVSGPSACRASSRSRTSRSRAPALPRSSEASCVAGACPAPASTR